MRIRRGYRYLLCWLSGFLTMFAIDVFFEARYQYNRKGYRR